MKELVRRLLSLAIGLPSLYLLVAVDQYSAQSTVEFIVRFLVNAAFIAYGLGGKKLLLRMPLIESIASPLTNPVSKSNKH